MNEQESKIAAQEGKLKNDGKFSSKEIILKMAESNKVINAHEVLLKRIPKDHMLITTTTDVAKKINKNTIFTSTTNKSSQKSRTFEPLGIVVIAILNWNCNVLMGLPWEFNLENEIKFAKPSICSTYLKTSHFESKGYISSFGNKGFFFNER